MATINERIRAFFRQSREMRELAAAGRGPYDVLYGYADQHRSHVFQTRFNNLLVSVIGALGIVTMASHVDLQMQLTWGLKVALVAWTLYLFLEVIGLSAFVPRASSQYDQQLRGLVARVAEQKLSERELAILLERARHAGSGKQGYIPLAGIVLVGLVAVLVFMPGVVQAQFLLPLAVVVLWRAVAAQQHTYISGLIAYAIEEHQLQHAR